MLLLFAAILAAVLLADASEASLDADTGELQTLAGRGSSPEPGKDLLDEE